MIKILQHKPYHNKYKIEFEFKFFDHPEWKKDERLSHTREAAVNYLYESKRVLLLHNYEVWLNDRAEAMQNNIFARKNPDKALSFERCTAGYKYWQDNFTDLLDICKMIIKMEYFMLELSGTSGQSFEWLCEIIKFAKHEQVIEGGRLYVPSE